MIIEVLAAACVAIAGTIGIALWADSRCALDASGLRTLCGLVLATVTIGVLALRLTALDFRLGSVAAAFVCLAGWTLTVLLTTRPRPVVVPLSADDD